MARYGRDYSNDFEKPGRARQERGGWRSQQPGNVRPDAPGDQWYGFPGEAGRGSTGPRYDDGFRGQTGQGGSRGGGGNQGYGASGWGAGYGGRDIGYENGPHPSRGRDAEGSDDKSRQMRAADLMTEDPKAVTPEATLVEVAKLMKELDVGIIPVITGEDNRRLRGVITDRDIAIRAVAEGKDGKTRVSECMTDDVETVNKNDPVRKVLELMQREQVRRVPVTDREGRLVGIIAQADLAVEYADTSHRRLHKVQDTIDRISQPARPDRSGNFDRMAAGARERSQSEQ